MTIAIIIAAIIVYFIIGIFTAACWLRYEDYEDPGWLSCVVLFWPIFALVVIVFSLSFLVMQAIRFVEKRLP